MNTRADQPGRLRGLTAVVCTLLALANGGTLAAPSRAASVAPDEAVVAVGEAMYLRGELPSGAPLAGTQSGVEIRMQGADAACVNCHRRSGLGSQEGGSFIPPVTGEYLFRPRLPGAHEGAMPAVEGLHRNRAAYTDTTLARAIRSGVDSEGRSLSELMPRFELDDTSMAALIAYLKQLTPRHPPGVHAGLLHFATIVTPEVDPKRRDAVLDVIEHYVAEKNSSLFRPNHALDTSGMSAHTKSTGLANLRWQEDPWELAGPEETWPAQLDRQFAEHPVFAVLSGFGGAHWSAVHEFCERHRVPCLFPNVDVPVVSDQGFYSVYFSRGVLLEADLIAKAIEKDGAPGEALVVRQIYRRGDSGVAAAAALANALRGQKVKVTNEALPAQASPRELRAALSRGYDSAVLVLWLRSSDVAALAGLSPPVGRVYLSGLMGGLESTPLPQGWRDKAALSYPFELPQRRGVQLDYSMGWFAFRHIPVVDARAQADTFLACNLLTDALNLMGEEVSPAYLIEQLQRLLEHHALTGYYPRLSLGTHQQFASKGGYIVHFGGSRGAALVAESPWTIP